jgi:opine dehydrogenase
MKVAVLGTGDAASALAARARSRGHRVVIWGRSGPRLDRLRRSAAIPVEPDLRTAVAAADTVVLAVASTAQATVLAQAAAALRDDHVVFLVPGHTGGLWTAAAALPATSKSPIIAETPLPFVCRTDSMGQPQILQDKAVIPLAAWPPAGAGAAAARAAALGWPVGSLVTPLESALQNLTVVFQPALMICNASRVEDGRPFAIYYDGVTPSVGRLWAALDRERLAVAAGLGVTVPSAAQWLRATYGARGDTLADLIRSVPGYRSITAPDRLDHRFLREHVQAGLIPTISLARYARVPVPVMEGVVELACALLGTDLRTAGRDLSAFLPVSCPDSTLQEVRLS